MRKMIALLMATGVATSLAVVAFVSSTSATAATTITVIEHEVSEHFVDLGQSGLGPGDFFTFHNPIYNSTNTTRVGRDQGSCIRITRVLANNRGSWECSWTTFLHDGTSTVTAESPFYDTGQGTGAITGGTGVYVGAGGTIDLTNCTETQCTFRFNLS
jgi:allene oxide cyclase